MPLKQVEAGKKRDPRTGHSFTTAHYLNSSSPPHTVYMAPRLPRRPAFHPGLPSVDPDHCCDRCGRLLQIADWPFCPH